MSSAPVEMKVELHSQACSCRGGSWVVFGDTTGSPCAGARDSAVGVVGLTEWRTLGKPADLETYREASARVTAGERREFQRFEVTLGVRIGRLPSWKTPNAQVEETVTEVIALGGALVRSRMMVEKGEVLTFEADSYKTRAEVTYVSAPADSGDRLQRLGLRFLDAPLPGTFIPAGAAPLP